MKKNLLFLSASLFSLLTANAQITITQSDMPTLGKVITEATDTIYAGITPGASGASQTWNFSTLQNHTQDVTVSVVPSTLVGSSNFPSATLAGTNGGTNQDVYILTNASSFNMLGVYGDFGSMIGVSALKFQPLIKRLSLPSTYNTNYTSAYTYEFLFAYTSYPGIDSLKMDASVTTSSNIDGWGTITTPSLTNVPSIRQKYTEINTSSSFMKGPLTGGVWTSTGAPTVDTTNTYSWWSNTKQWTLAEITTNGNGVTTGAKYLVSMVAGGVGVQEAEKETAIGVYPNPATDNIHISGVNEVVCFMVSDVTGKLVSNTVLKSYTNTYSVANLENGIYFYQAVGVNGKVIGKGKFVVAK